MKMRTNQPETFPFFALSLITLLVMLSACRPYHATPHDALTEFPGYLSQENIASLTILQQEVVAEGRVMLYRYQPDPMVSEYCVATTFVTQEKRGGWRAQSASRLECGDKLSEKFTPAYTVGGNITELTTVYGLSNKGSQVRIHWSDGMVSIAPVANNVFLSARPATLQVNSIALLDENDMILEETSWAEFGRDSHLAQTLADRAGQAGIETMMKTLTKIILILLPVLLLIVMLVVAQKSRTSICDTPLILFVQRKNNQPDVITNRLVSEWGGLPKIAMDIQKAQEAINADDVPPIYPVDTWVIETSSAANSSLNMLFDDDPIYNHNFIIHVTYADGEKSVLQWSSWSYGFVACPFVVSMGIGPPGQLKIMP